MDADIDTNVGQLSAWSMAGFWLVWLGLVSARAAAMGWSDQGGMLLRRLGMATLGVGLMLGVQAVFGRLGRPQRLAWRVGAMFLAVVPVTLVFTVLNVYVFYRWAPVPSVAADLARWQPHAVIVTAIADGLVTWYFFFAAWAALELAIGQIGDARRAERRGATARAEAREARLAMLRLQVDPHFLFNALNTLSALVGRGEPRAARAMIGELAAFFRAGLTLEPSAEVPLADELALQRQYLAIERARFGERLVVHVDVPAPLLDAEVPALILQPLVENAVKHGLARHQGPRPVTIAITAWVAGDRLHVRVADDSGDEGDGALGLAGGPVSTAGTGIGLGNVRARLDTRYGPAGYLLAGPAAGGWASEIVVPLAQGVATAVPASAGLPDAAEWRDA